MKNLFLILLFAPLITFAQDSFLNVSELSGNKKPVSCTTVFSLRLGSDAQRSEAGIFNMQVIPQGNTFLIISRLTLASGRVTNLDSAIISARDLKPVFSSSISPARDLRVNYNNGTATVHYFDKSDRKSGSKQETNIGAYYETGSYLSLMTLLPLRTGFKGKIPVYEYDVKNGTGKTYVDIQEVKSGEYKSPKTGTHQVWDVLIHESGSGNSFRLLVDKAEPKLWQVVLTGQSNKMYYVNTEADYNPIKAPFDKAKTMAMITKGNSVISGETYIKDNETEGGLLGDISVLNINKKQFAPKGTVVVLIPYTEYFKEWEAQNKKMRKTGISIPLSDDALACMKQTTVYNDKGNFEFVNLMPGEYVVYTDFGYNHSYGRNEVVGYTDHYINGMYQRTTDNVQRKTYNTTASVALQKIVKISKDGETVTMKLKKT